MRGSDPVRPRNPEWWILPPGSSVRIIKHSSHRNKAYTLSPSLSLPPPIHSLVHSFSFPLSLSLADILRCNAARLMHTLSLYSNTFRSASIHILEEFTRATRHCRAHSLHNPSILLPFHPPSTLPNSANQTYRGTDRL